MVGSIALRPTTIDDAEPISALFTASYPVLMTTAYPADLLQDILPVITQTNPTLLSSGTFYMVENDQGQAIGCGGWTRERPGSSETIPGLSHIRHFATHPDWIGQGIGTAIYKCCEKNARLANTHTFECYSSLNAQAFYESLGFIAQEKFSVPMGPELQFPSIRMYRSILELASE